nr:MAG TPA: hypothetical protein [Caudoviricetes sp.]
MGVIFVMASTLLFSVLYIKLIIFLFCFTKSAIEE